MKSAALATVLAFTTFAVANPLPGGKEHWHQDEWKKGEWKDELKGWPKKYDFTSTYAVVATPDQVINGTVPTPGQPGAIGFYKFGINSKTDTICYDIILKGVTGPYQSPAKTATHIHAAKKGASGPPRLAFPNPEGDKKYRRSKGCMNGPFTTGVLANGVDTGTAFMLKQIEANPAGFFCDAHTKLYVPGVVRGQLG